MSNNFYISHTNDHPQKKYGDGYLLAVKLDDEILSNLNNIVNSPGIDVPYPVSYRFGFPTENVKLLEIGFLDDFLKDAKVYESWERGNEDPLEYYRFNIHPYELKEDWEYAQKPLSATLIYGGRKDFGFDAYYNGENYCGYCFDWSRYLEGN